MTGHILADAFQLIAAITANTVEIHRFGHGVHAAAKLCQPVG